jgi:hypothetical protein
MTEPNVATQDDFVRIREEDKRRSLLSPLRYHMAGTGGVVMASAFDRLRDAYLEATDVTSTDVSLEAKVRYQAREIQRLQAVLVSVRLALGNFGHLVAAKIVEKEDGNAIKEGVEFQSRIFEHSYGNSSRQTTETSCCNRSVESGKVQPPQEQSTQQESARQVKYKWESEPIAFRRAETYTTPGLVPEAGPEMFDYSKGPYLPPNDDRSSKDRFFSGLFKQQPSCE